MDPIEAALRAYLGDGTWSRFNEQDRAAARIDMARAFEAHTRAVKVLANDSKDQNHDQRRTDRQLSTGPIRPWR